VQHQECLRRVIDVPSIVSRIRRLVAASISEKER